MLPNHQPQHSGRKPAPPRHGVQTVRVGGGARAMRRRRPRAGTLAQEDPFMQSKRAYNSPANPNDSFVMLDDIDDGDYDEDDGDDDNNNNYDDYDENGNANSNVNDNGHIDGANDMLDDESFSVMWDNYNRLQGIFDTCSAIVKQGARELGKMKKQMISFERARCKPEPSNYACPRPQPRGGNDNGNNNRNMKEYDFPVEGDKANQRF